MRRLRSLLRIGRQVWRGAGEDRVSRLAAALAYYAVFSLPGLLVLVVTVAALAWGYDAVQRTLTSELAVLVGRDGAAALGDVLARASEPTGSSLVAQVVGAGALVFGAGRFFLELQEALNRVWKAPPEGPHERTAKRVRRRLLSFGLVLGLGLLAVISLAAHAALSAIGDRLANTWFSGASGGALVAAETLVSTALLALLLAAIYKVLPDVHVGWREVWLGAVVTAVVFAAGKYAIGAYLGRSDPGSVYGAAGPLVLLILWIYYATTVVLLGAELTRVVARRRRRRVHAARLRREGR